MTECQNCGKKIKDDRKFCEECKGINTGIYYAYRQLRFDMWEYLDHHGKNKTREFYNKIIDEEGEKWTREVLGEKLVDAILGKFGTTL